MSVHYAVAMRVHVLARVVPNTIEIKVVEVKYPNDVDSACELASDMVHTAYAQAGHTPDMITHLCAVKLEGMRVRSYTEHEYTLGAVITEWREQK